MKTIRELINLIETAQNPVDDDVEHLANVAADAYWSGKFGMTSATEKVKMARDIVQAVEDGRLSIEELRQDIRDLDKPGVAEGSNDTYDIIRTNDYGKKDFFAGNYSLEQAKDELAKCLAHPLHTKYGHKFAIVKRNEQGVAEGTNGWVVYNIRGRIIKNFADEAEARQYAKQYGFYVKPQGVAEALSKTDLLKQVSETYTPTAGELAQDHIKMADGDFNKKYGMSKQQANHYYSSSKLKEPSPREKEAAKWGRKSSVYPFSR